MRKGALFSVAVAAVLAACGGGVVQQGSPDGSGGACGALTSCCGNVAGATASLCSDVAGAGNAEDCDTELGQLQAQGYCTSASGSSSSGSGGPGGNSSGSSSGSGASGSGGTPGTDGGSGAGEGGPGADATVPSTDSGSSPSDAALPPLDAAPAGLAGFAFIVNGVVQHPMSCPGVNWEFPPAPGTTDPPSGCMPSGGGVCPGVESVIIVNTGALDMPYVAGPWWNGQNYVPGGYPGGDYLAGVLAPGASVDITAYYNTGDVAILGSAEPFSAWDASYAADEGTITWPPGVSGSGGATTMYIAEIEVRSACSPVQQNW